MAIGDTKNPNLFGADYNAGEEEQKRLEAEALLAAQNARIGSGEAQAPVTFLPYADDVSTPRASALSVFTPGGDLKPGIDVNAITPAPEMISPSAVNTALNQEVPVESQVSSGPDFSNMSGTLSPFTKGILSSLQRGITQPQFGMMGIDPIQNPYKDTIAATDTQPPSATSTFGLTPSVTPSVENLPEVAQGAPDSPQANFATRMATGEALTPQEIQDAQAFAASMGTTFDPATGYSREAYMAGQAASNQQQPDLPGAIPPLQTFVGPSGTGYQEAPEGMVKAMGPDGKMVFTTPEQADQMNQSYLSELNASKQAQKDFLSSNVGQNEMTLQGMRNAVAQEQQANGGQAAQRPNLPGFNAGQNTQGSINNPSFDAGQGGQGRLKVQTVPQSSDFFQRGPTPQGSLTDFGSLTNVSGEPITTLSQLKADMNMRSMSESDDSKKMSYSDAKIRARGEFAARNIDPSPSQLRALTKSIQAAEPERLAGLETERALNEARLQTAQAEQNKPEFRGRVYTVDGVTFAQTSRGGVQVISTGTENPEKALRIAQEFEFTKKKIEDAREAYLAGDVTKANDILASADIKQYGYQANAAQYFADSTPPVTPSDPASPVTASGLTEQQEANITRQAFDTMGEAEAANLPKGTKITIGGRNATV
tara:strand:- start:449 stop:2407 length:1959 start_codon:yes stop_codon:yes gene_type:complete